MNTLVSKRLTLTLLGVTAIVMLIGATQIWVTYQLAPGSSIVTEVSVRGHDAASGILPIALAILAITVTLTISGRLTRTVLALLSVVLAFWVASTSLAILGGAQTHLVALGASELYEVTGLGGTAHEELVTGVTLSLWPAAMMGISVLTGVLSLVVLIAGWRWQAGGRKYRSSSSRMSAGEPRDRIYDWDAQSDGEDLSDDSHHPGDSSTDLSANR